MDKEELQDSWDNHRRPVGSKHPALIVLEALLIGSTTELGGQKYIIGIDTESKSERISTPVCWNGEHKLVGVDLSLDTFLWLCNRLSNDELWIIGSNAALNKAKQIR